MGLSTGETRPIAETENRRLREVLPAVRRPVWPSSDSSNDGFLRPNSPCRLEGFALSRTWRTNVAASMENREVQTSFVFDTHFHQKRTASKCTRGRLGTSPSVVSADADMKRIANACKLHRCSLAKNCAASFKISRSIRSMRFSACRCRSLRRATRIHTATPVQCAGSKA